MAEPQSDGVGLRTIENGHSLCQRVLLRLLVHKRLTFGEQSFVLEPASDVPRLTAAQEQQVRDRIIHAAVAVFAEKGYHRATIADVVRALRAVGRRDLHALHRQGGAVPPQLRPDLRAGPRRARDPAGAADVDRRSPARPRSRTTSRRSTSSTAPPGQVESRPGLGRGRRGARRPRDARASARAALGAAQLLLREGIARGELPDWLDVDAFARGLHGAARWPAAPAHRGRRRLSTGGIDAAGERHPRCPACRPTESSDRPSRRRSIGRPCPRPDGPRSHRSGRSRVHAPARAHPDRAVAHPCAVGLLATDPR